MAPTKKISTPKAVKPVTAVKPVVKKTVKKETVAVAPVKPVVAPVVTSAPAVKLTRFLNKNILISPRKLRLMAKNIKNLSPLQAIDKLKFTNTKSARILVKSLTNALANAKNIGLNPDSLQLHTIQVNEGLKIKRMDKSHGSRFNRGMILKRHSRLEIVLSGRAL